ncbi:MAG: M4 family metallopeptidase [Desulfobacteraceae bacterium]|nr:M4 family metallopeptidase [Desulfobacteraceae bacterium]
MKKWIICFVLATCFVYSHTWAVELREYQAGQVDVDAQRVIMRSRTSIPHWADFKPSSNIKHKNFFSRYRGLSSQNTFRQKRQIIDNLGIRHTCYQQYYKGLRVINAEYILHEKGNRIFRSNGIIFSGLAVDVNPTLKEPEAFELALQHVGADIYTWQVKAEDNKRAFGELAISGRNPWLDKENLHLVYRFDIETVQPLARFVIDISAKTGELINKISKMYDNTLISSPSYYNADVDIWATENSSNSSYTSYALSETISGGGITTYNTKVNTFLLNFGMVVLKNTSESVVSVPSSFKQDPEAVNVHWAIERTYDYFYNIHGRSSYDNADKKIEAYVMTNYGGNAFYLSDKIYFGGIAANISGYEFGPLISIDVVSHEFTHGITEYSAGLEYRYESGALNESFSDIFGEMVEKYASGENDWLIGDDVHLNGNGIRNFINPNEDRQPDTYKGDYWHANASDNGGVHINNGVGNHWFYLLSEGGSGTNDNGGKYQVEGIGTEKAAKIAYQALTAYLTSASDYADAYTATMAAAQELFSTSAQESVKSAWDAVGVTN